MPVTHDEWLRFVEGGPIPYLSPAVAESWLRCRTAGLDFASKQNPRLSAIEFNDRCNRVRWFLARLDTMVAKIQYRFEGSISFSDTDYYQLYCELVGQRSHNPAGSRFIGCRLAEELIGNGVSNMSLIYQRPMALSHYEHIDQVMHGHVGYAEPIEVDGKIIGSLAVYICTQDKEEGLTLAYNVVRSLTEFCLAGDKMTIPSSANNGYVAKHTFDDLFCQAAVMKEIREKGRLLSRSDHPILIQGESGTGKELLAQAIHNGSHRRHHAFVAINCAAFPEDLMASELFGYSEGAFTGASKGGKKGKFELADQGTVFLDEVGDLAPPAQAMLLRTLQEHQVTRLGDDRTIPVNFRVISATNKDLGQMCSQGLFRWDLYYRLAGAVLALPPLRERQGSVAAMAQHFLDQINLREHGSKRIALEAMEMVASYHWPGNVRELKNMLETAYLLAPRDEINGQIAADLLHVADFVRETDTEQTDKREIFFATFRVSGKVTESAAKAQISRATAYRWLRDQHEE